MLSRLFLLIIFFSVIGGLVSAGTLNVPADYAGIQLAINASINGDTVLVAPGTYYENINFRGKRIVLTSWFALGGDVSYIEQTVINGSMPAHPDTASCVLIVSGEDTTTVFQGFTLTGGRGTKWKDIHNGSIYREGGGILMEFSTAIVQYNVIVNNDASDKTGVASCGGGGIRIGDGNPRIFNNMIMFNRGRYGGGVVLNFTGAILKNNIVYRNTGGEDFGGSGVWANSNGSAPKILENNTILENISALDGAGVYISSTSMSIQNCIIWGNVAPVDSSITIGGGTVSVAYSNVQNGYRGPGNINTDPQFNDTSFYLLPTSPCVDAGNPAAGFNDPEDSGNPGFAKFPSHGSLRNDIGAYGGKRSFPLIYVDMHLDDPKYPSNFHIYSDYTSPSSATLFWNDPTETKKGIALQQFKIHIYRDDVFLAEVDSGVQSFFDSGLMNHQLYRYKINTVIPGDSSAFDSSTVYAGGAAEPKGVSQFTGTDNTNGATLSWKNPSTQLDGTPLNDLAFILIYKDGILFDSVAQTINDTSQTRSYFDPTEGYHFYKMQVRDNEIPVHYSTISSEISGFGGLVSRYDEGFEDGFGKIYTKGTWDTTHHIAHRGGASFTDSPAGLYGQNSNTYIMLPPVILGYEPILQYYDAAIIRLGNFAYVEISNDGRKSFSTLKLYNSYSYAGWQDGTADSTDWLKEFIDLKNYAGDTVTFRFRLLTNSSVPWDGWYIDDITIKDAGEMRTDSMVVTEGWNMVSLPVKVDDGSIGTVFPQARSQAYSFHNGYAGGNELNPGDGYFIKFDSAQTIFFNGHRTWRDTITVQKGWNIVGGITDAFEISSIVTVPAGIITSPFYRYQDQAYGTEEILLPGKAFWVKVSQNGKFILSGTP